MIKYRLLNGHYYFSGLFRCDLEGNVRQVIHRYPRPYSVWNNTGTDTRTSTLTYQFLHFVCLHYASYKYHVNLKL